MKLAPLVLALALALGACAETPAQIVYAAGVGYQSAAPLVVAYERLPRCDATAPPGSPGAPAAPAAPIVCSDPAAVVEIKRADNVVFVALKQAQSIVADPTKTASAMDAAANAARSAWTVFLAIAAQYRIALPAGV